MALLRRIKSDCTFNQLSPFKSLPLVGPYWSLDLSAATDRFPVKVQVRVVEALVGCNQYAASWHSIMTSGSFFNPWGPPVKYTVGQPMGAYSSWATFAISHHLAVRVAAVRAGKPASWCNYALLGDDIVLTDKLVADQYLILMRELGVSISEAKSHVSNDTFEFAKRWYQNGGEISGIQLSQWLEVSNWSQLAEALRTSLSRWSLAAHQMDSGSLIPLLAAFSQRLRDVQKVKAYLHLPRADDEEMVRSEKINFLARTLFPSVFNCFPRDYMRSKFIFETLAEVKTGYLEQGIVNAFTLINKFFVSLRTSELVNGLPDQGLLLLLPPIESIRAEALSLQASLEDLQSAYYDRDEDIVFSNILVKMTDPTRVMAGRKLKVMISARAALVNNYKLWTKSYYASRDWALTDQPEDNTQVSDTGSTLPSQT
jgi:hypothetical protein